MSKQVLAFDIGASNGRAIVGEYIDGQILLHEVHRFSNDPVQLNGYLYWDFPRLFHELKTSLVKAKNHGFNVLSVGVDTWGVDYGLIDEDGELMANPIHYRDERAQQGMNQLLERFNEEDLKKQTGMDCVSYNTVNQLMNERLLKKSGVTAMLNMPDLFNYFLTGIKGSEYSMASTTQLFDYKKDCWNDALIESIGINKDIFQEIIPSGTVVGNIKESIQQELKIKPVKVVSITSHDTAAAIRSVQTDDEDFLFIATGTWIIVGSKQKKMVMNDKVMTYNLTNEGGKYPNVNLLKNHVGLWMLQEVKRELEKEGHEISFTLMIDEAEKAQIDSHVDILDTRFFEPGDMSFKVQAFCKETKQTIPETMGEIVKVIEQSLAKQIAETLDHIEEAANKQYDTVYLFGGGVQDRLLCHLIEEYSGKKVILGAKEATAFGNVIDQFVALDVFDETKRIDILKNSI